MNENYVEYRGLKGWQRFNWDEVEGMRGDDDFGHKLYIKGLKPKYIWVYGHGNAEVAMTFLEKDKFFLME